MRRIEAAVVLVFLASCAVKTTSDALCHTDGNCPADERCQLAGSDAGRCVACVPDARCVNVEGTSCSADGAAAVTCQRNAGSCWYRSEVNCASQGLTCGSQEGAFQCLCPDNSEAAVLYVDPAHGATSPHATGVKDPPQCRYRTLTDALALAQVQAQAGGTAVHVVAIGSTGSSTPLVFRSTDETLPLNVAPGVALVTDDAQPGAAPSGAYVVEFDAAAHAALNLHDGSTVSGLVLRNTSTLDGAVAAVSLDDCTGNAKVSIDGLSIEALSPGNFAAASGVELSSPCDATFSNLAIKQTSGDGLVVSGGAKVDATDLAVAGSTGGNGVTITGSVTTVALHGGSLTGNAKNGIEVAAGGSLQIDAQEGHAVAISDNGVDGLRVQASPVTLAGIETARITIENNQSDGILFCDGDSSDCPSTSGAKLDAQYLSVNKNGNGIEIRNANGAVVGIRISSFTDNANSGISVATSTLASSNVHESSTTVDACQITGGVHGIELTGGETWMTVSNSRLTEASDTGFVSKLPGGSRAGLVLTGNQILGNKAQTPRGVEAANQRKVGGMFFTQGTPALQFHGNTVAGNEGDQVFVSSTDPTVWDFSGSTDCHPNDPSANVFACYAADGTGVGVAAEGAKVLVGGAHWRVAPLVNLIPNTDFTIMTTSGISGSITLDPVCDVATVACQ